MRKPTDSEIARARNNGLTICNESDLRERYRSNPAPGVTEQAYIRANLPSVYRNVLRRNRPEWDTR